MNISKEIEKLAQLSEKLQGSDLKKKISILNDFVSPFFNKTLIKHLKKVEGDDERLNIFLSLLAMGQDDLFEKTTDINALLEPLIKVEIFYENIGGLIGYHLKTLLELQNKKTALTENYEVPLAIDFSQIPSDKLNEAVLTGVLFLPKMAEIHLVGGLGDRLKLKTINGEPLPAATLPFLGKSLLEILVRDLFGKEYLYYKLFNERVTVPIALMTSLEKENETHIRQLLMANKWFERDPEAFLLFRQVLVPVITCEGNWVLKGDNEVLLHPGGHGTLWKTAEDEGVYNWLEEQKKEAFLIRQINNPVAGIDFGLLALAGFGFLNKKTLGIASCQRAPHAAEGVLVNVKKGENSYATINIEYTEFSQSKIVDQPLPTNTNILFVHLQKIRGVIKKHPIPDFLLNMKAKIVYKTKEVLSGRLESMVQNITHHLTAPKKEELPVFVTYNERSKTIATTKKSYVENQGLLETPEGAFFDMMKEAHNLLTKACGVLAPPFCTAEEYLKHGPSLLFLYHPALGPLYDIISKKILNGMVKNNSELQLEIAELLLEDFYLEGSLIIETKTPHSAEGGRCFLKGVKVINKGIDRKPSTTYWKNGFSRKERLKIVLKKNAEFIAENVTFTGNQTIIVPPNKRLLAFDEDGQIHFEYEEVKVPTVWRYSLDGNQINLVRPEMPELIKKSGTGTLTGTGT